MIENRRYCPEIIQQLKASRKALLAVEAELLRSHIDQCVTDVLLNKSKKDREEKINEVVKLFKGTND